MIAFSLAGRDYGIDIMKVKEISHEGRFTYVPNTAPYVLGVHNLRGEIIPIIDLRRMFNTAVPQTKEGAEQNVLILRLERLVLGVVVDSIDGVMSAPADAIQPPHPIFGEINMQYLSGVVEKGGKLYVILDVERIFQENAPSVQKKVAFEKPAVVQSEDQELKFVCEGLSTFASFSVTPVNVAWVEKRFTEWKRMRQSAGLSAQLRGEEDAREFLSTLGRRKEELWSDAERDAVLGFLPSSLSGSFVVWNHGCGRGFDAYSAVCALKSAFPALAVKVWASDANLLQIAAAPTLAVQVDRVPRFYAAFLQAKEGSAQFAPAVKESIVFEYTESMARAENLEVNLVIARDMISFLRPDAQKAMVDTFSQRLKPGGLLIVGSNETVSGEAWRAVEKGGLRAFQRVQSGGTPPKE